jgi:hypothetical protein
MTHNDALTQTLSNARTYKKHGEKKREKELTGTHRQTQAHTDRHHTQIHTGNLSRRRCEPVRPAAPNSNVLVFK